MSSQLFKDKTRDELVNERLAMLTDIAKELEGDIVFPVCFDVSVQISCVMKSKTASMQRVAQEVQKDPLITAKLLQLANSTVYNPAGVAIVDIVQALTRLGMETARSVALACAIKQMGSSHKSAELDRMSQAYWAHSLKTAIYARVIARRLTRVNPDIAMLAGLVHDLGAFYMLNRAEQYPDLVERPESVSYLVAQWHDSIGSILLDSLGMPEEVIEAVRDNDMPRPTVRTPRTLSDVIYLANIFSGGYEEMKKLDLDGLQEPEELKEPMYLDLLGEMQEAAQEIATIW